MALWRQRQLLLRPRRRLLRLLRLPLWRWLRLLRRKRRRGRWLPPLLRRLMAHLLLKRNARGALAYRRHRGRRAGRRINGSVASRPIHVVPSAAATDHATAPASAAAAAVAAAAHALQCVGWSSELCGDLRRHATCACAARTGGAGAASAIATARHARQAGCHRGAGRVDAA